MLVFQFAFAGASQASERYLGYSDYQVITDRHFRLDRYFQALARQGVNFQRIWVTGYSGAARNVEELLPFARHRRRYNLNAYNQQYFQRLRQVMEQAQTNRHRVMLTLFDHWSLSREFRKTPWFFKNNVQQLLKEPFPHFYSLENRKLVRIQEDLVREVVRQTKQFQPIYEIMNEGASANCQTLSVWHEKVASWILEEFPEAEIAVNLKSECAEVLNADWVSIVSFHQNIWEKNGICESIRKYPDKHVIIDTDGAWEVRDDNRLVKTWLDEALSCGGSFNHKDNIYDLDLEFLKFYREMNRKPSS